jgi:hypothetical protein
MISLGQFNVFAASRGEGLHPKLQALLERSAASPFAEVLMRRDGLSQAGPSPASEVAPSPDSITPFARELTGSVVTTVPKRQISKNNPTRDRIA